MLQQVDNVARPVGWFFNWVGIIIGIIAIIGLLIGGGMLATTKRWKPLGATASRDSECEQYAVKDGKESGVKCATPITIQSCTTKSDAQGEQWLYTEGLRYVPGDNMTVFQSPDAVSSGKNDKYDFSDDDGFELTDNGVSQRYTGYVLILIAILVASSVAASFTLRNNAWNQRIQSVELLKTIF
jgi:hypothetical protein